MLKVVQKLFKVVQKLLKNCSKAVQKMLKSGIKTADMQEGDVKKIKIKCRRLLWMVPNRTAPTHPGPSTRPIKNMVTKMLP